MANNLQTPFNGGSRKRLHLMLHLLQMTEWWLFEKCLFLQQLRSPRSYRCASSPLLLLYLHNRTFTSESQTRGFRVLTANIGCVELDNDHCVCCNSYLLTC